MRHPERASLQSLSDATDSVLRDLYAREFARDRLDFACRVALEIHLQDSLLQRAGQATVALEDFGQEGHLAGTGHAELIDVAGLGRQAPLVMAVAFTPTGRGALAMPILELLGHLLLHDLFKHGFDAFTDTALDLVAGHSFVFVVHRLNLLSVRKAKPR